MSWVKNWSGGPSRPQRRSRRRGIRLCCKYREVLTPQPRLLFAFPFCQFEPPDSRGQGSFGFSFRDRPISGLFPKSAYVQKTSYRWTTRSVWWTEITWRHTPTSSLDNTEDSGQRLRQPEVKKTRRGNVTISYGKFKVNHPIVGLSLIDTTGIFSDLYITGYTRQSILYDSASPLSYLCSQNGTNPISVSITSYNCLSQILMQH